MSSAAVAGVQTPDQAAHGAKGGSRRKLLILAAPALLAAILAGLWFGGILPPLIGMGAKPAHTEAGATKPEGAREGKAEAAKADKTTSIIEIPEIVANLNAGARRTSYVKLHARLELSRPEDEAALKNAMPRLLDLFQTYLREIRPEELRGSAGTYRLREELIARANIALAPIRVVDVLFPELLIQ